MVARRWSSFNHEVTNKELSAIPNPDRSSLFRAMKAYRLDLGIHYAIKNYGDGLLMIKNTNRTAGRCLFFCESFEEGEVVLVALLAYKKESDEAPSHLLEAARARMKEAQK